MARTKESIAAQNKFYESGKKLPKCVNNGCNNEVQVRDWKYHSIKSECSRCSGARKKGRTISGVTMHKKIFCENVDGHLGFPCPIKKEEMIHYPESLELDHLDGNHYNNVPENVKTYCSLCHNRKSKENNDWHSNKPSGIKF